MYNKKNAKKYSEYFIPSLLIFYFLKTRQIIQSYNEYFILSFFQQILNYFIENFDSLCIFKKITLPCNEKKYLNRITKLITMIFLTYRKQKTFEQKKKNYKFQIKHTPQAM